MRRRRGSDAKKPRQQETEKQREGGEGRAADR